MRNLDFQSCNFDPNIRRLVQKQLVDFPRQDNTTKTDLLRELVVLLHNADDEAYTEMLIWTTIEMMSEQEG